MNNSNEFACYALESYKTACLIIAWNLEPPTLGGPLDLVHPAHPTATPLQNNKTALPGFAPRPQWVWDPQIQVPDTTPAYLQNIHQSSNFSSVRHQDATF